MKKTTKTRKHRKLTLHRETLRHLDTARLGSVRGGTASFDDDCSEVHCVGQLSDGIRCDPK